MTIRSMLTLRPSDRRSFCNAAATVALFSTFAIVQGALGADPPTLAEIDKVWRERENRTSSFKVKWKETTKESRQLAADPFVEDAGPGAPFAVHTYERTLIVQGKQLRFEDGAPIWRLDRGGVYEYGQSAHVDNGKAASVSFHSADDGGELTRTDRCSGGRVSARLRTWIDIHPIIDHYRPSWRLRDLCELGEYEIEHGTLGDVECAVVKIDISIDRELHRYTLWLEKPHYTVRRIARHFNGTLASDFTRTFTSSDDMVLALSGWTTNLYTPTGIARRITKATVIESSLNEKFDDAMFTTDAGAP